MSEIGPKTVRTEQYEFEARSSDPPNAEPGEYWIRTDQTSSNPDVVAELRRQDTSGVSKIPLFDDSEESNLGSKMARGPSVVLGGGSIGFVAMSTDSGAEFGSPRAVTAAGTEYLSHNKLTLMATPDSVIARFDPRQENTGSAKSTLNNQESNKNLSGSHDVISSGINNKQSYRFDGTNLADNINISAGNNPFAVIITIQQQETNKSNGVYFGEASNTNGFELHDNNDGQTNITAIGSGTRTTNTVAVDQNPHVYAFIYDGSDNYRLKVDSTTNTVFDGSLTSINQLSGFALAGRTNNSGFDANHIQADYGSVSILDNPASGDIDTEMQRQIDIWL